MTTEAATKPCPFCAETIQAAAIVCRYCGRNLVEKPPEKPAPHIVRKETGYICSECGGFLRPDASSCKHCNAVFSKAQAIEAALKAPAVPAKRPPAWAYALVTLAFLGACAWFFGLTGGHPITPRAPAASTVPVFYRIELSGATVNRASLTYHNETGGIEQKEVTPPWEMNFRAKSGQFVSISAQKGGTTGTIKCIIAASSVTLQEATSSADYGIASCSGLVP